MGGAGQRRRIFDCSHFFFFQEKVLVAAVDAIGSIVLVTIVFLQMRQKKKEK